MSEPAFPDFFLYATLQDAFSTEGLSLLRGGIICNVEEWFGDEIYTLALA